MQEAALEAMVYYVWHARNEAFWIGKLHTIEYTIKQIKSVVKYRSLGYMPKKISVSDKNQSRTVWLYWC